MMIFIAVFGGVVIGYGYGWHHGRIMLLQRLMAE